MAHWRQINFFIHFRLVEQSMKKAAEISKEHIMKRLLGLVFMVMVLVPFMASVTPAYEMHEDDARATVDVSYQAVENVLAALQSANASGDTAKIDLALQALDLAMANYAVASDHLAMIQAGNPVDDAILLACDAVTGALNSFSSLVAANDLDAAQVSFTHAQGLAADLPPPASPGALPAGLAGIESQIIAASAEASSILWGTGGGTGGGIGDGRWGGTQNASPI